MEIERKFLLGSLPNIIKTSDQYQIEQAYISLIPEKRVRKINNSCFFTEKGEGGLIRTENEFEISPSDYQEYILKKVGHTIRKTRYKVNLENYIAEIDEYHDQLQGLLVVEVEFETLEQSADFTPPIWFGREITELKAFKNKNLALLDRFDPNVLSDIINRAE